MPSVTTRDIVTSEWLLERIPGRTSEEVAAAITELVDDGELVDGSRLPTIRDMAKTAGMSVGAVLTAWNLLRDAGLIETHRRGGTIVTTTATGTSPSFAITDEADGFAGWASVDLAQSAPDISLQPELGDALLSTLDAKNLNVFGRDQMTDRLLDAVTPTWPFQPEAWATAGGGTEALLLATAAAAPPGSVVAVDEPVGPGFLDTLRELELTPVGVAADDQGPTVESLRAALASNPVAFVFQPGAPFAVRHAVTRSRARDLAEVLAAHSADAAEPGKRIWVVEDDSIGPLAREESPSVGEFLPGQVIRIRSYCKAYGIDVRTSVVAGARELVDRAVQLRSHGVGSNSRILQNTLAYLIRSRAAEQSVETARAAYASRRDALLAALDAEGLTARSGPGSLVVWVEVSDETEALISLARKGISLGAGSKSFVTPPPTPLVRISVTQLPDDPALLRELAATIAKAARGTLREFFD
jgi:DNA-binding transcriptional MocR family regulator